MATLKLHCELYVDNAVFLFAILGIAEVWSKFGDGKHCHVISAHNITPWAA